MTPITPALRAEIRANAQAAYSSANGQLVDDNPIVRKMAHKICDAQEVVLSLLALIDKLEADVKRKDEALKPFSDAYDHYKDFPETAIMDEFEQIEIAHLSRAAAAREG